MSYRKVAPRDFFNEAKLLKCLGRLTLLILDGKAPSQLRYDESGDWNISRAYPTGDLYVVGVNIYANNSRLNLYSRYNSKENYTLECLTEDFNVIEVFNDDGSLSDEFCEHIKS